MYVLDCVLLYFATIDPLLNIICYDVMMQLWYVVTIRLRNDDADVVSIGENPKGLERDNV